MGATRSLSSRDGSTLPDPKRLQGPLGRENATAPGYGRGNGQPGVNGNDQNGVAPGSAQPQGAPIGAPQGPQGAAPPGSKLPRASMAQAPPGPPPQQQAPTPRSNGPIPAANGRGKPQGKPERGFGPAIDTNVRNPSVEKISGSPVQGQNRTMSPARKESPQPRESPLANGRRTPTQTQQASKPVGVENNGPPVSMGNNVGTTRTSSKTRTGRQQSSIDSTSEQSSLRNVTNARQTSPPPPTRQTSNPLARKGSARNSQPLHF